MKDDMVSKQFVGVLLKSPPLLTGLKAMVR
jgi:hypothetical protein